MVVGPLGAGFPDQQIDPLGSSPSGHSPDPRAANVSTGAGDRQPRFSHTPGEYQRIVPLVEAAEHSQPIGSPGAAPSSTDNSGILPFSGSPPSTRTSLWKPAMLR